MAELMDLFDDDLKTKKNKAMEKEESQRKPNGSERRREDSRRSEATGRRDPNCLFFKERTSVCFCYSINI